MSNGVDIEAELQKRELVRIPLSSFPNADIKENESIVIEYEIKGSKVESVYKCIEGHLEYKGTLQELTKGGNDG